MVILNVKTKIMIVLKVVNTVPG